MNSPKIRPRKSGISFRCALTPPCRRTIHLMTELTKNRKPEHIHRPTAGDSESGGVKGPPKESHPHHHQKSGDEKANTHRDNCWYIGCSRRGQPTLKSIERSSGKPIPRAFDVGNMIRMPRTRRMSRRRLQCTLQ